MKTKKILAYFLFGLSVIMAIVWDVFFFVLTHFYQLCKKIDSWGDRKLEEFQRWYDDLRE